ncbi:MAG: ABC transporter ATP-binding protein [Candidatus Nanopelagicales bacterium]
MTDSQAIETVGLTVRYGKARGITEINLAAHEGAVLGLVGPNGAGKTTWIRTVLDLVHPTSGVANIYKIDSKNPKARCVISYLPGELNLPKRLSGNDILRRFTSGRSDISKTEILKIADAFNIDLNRKIGALSKGNRQKVGLVLALAPKTPILLLDEPTSGLDPLMQKIFEALIKEKTQSGACVVLSSHVLSELENLADQIAVLREGKLAAFESMTSLKEKVQPKYLVQLKNSDNDALVRAALFNNKDVQIKKVENFLEITVKGSMDLVIKALSRVEVLKIDQKGGDIEDLLKTFYSEKGSDNV